MISGAIGLRAILRIQKKHPLCSGDFGNLRVQNQSQNLTVLPNETINIKWDIIQQGTPGKDLEATLKGNTNSGPLEECVMLTQIKSDQNKKKNRTHC